MKGQTEIEVDTDLPPLPPPPAFWPMTTSTYTPYKIKGRSQCWVCVYLVHSGAWAGPPRPAAKVRRKVKGAPMMVDGKPNPDVALLCYDHAHQYVTRDNAARAEVGLPALAGGG